MLSLKIKELEILFFSKTIYLYAYGFNEFINFEFELQSKRNCLGYICIKLNKNFKLLLFVLFFAIILFLFNNSFDSRFQRANRILIF